jgi:hypothetical protein
VRAARYEAASAQWHPPAQLGATSELSRHEPHTAIDAAGNAIVVWTLEIRYTGWPFRGYVIQAARYIAATGSWSSPTDLSVESAVAQPSLPR